MKEKGEKKPTVRIVRDMRVNEILNLRLSGAELYDIRLHAEEMKWNVSDSTLKRYIHDSDELIAASLEKDRDKLIRRHIAQRRSLYTAALNDGDYKTALAIAKDEAELENLYPAKVTKLTGDRDQPISMEVSKPMSDDERNAAIQRILTRFGVSSNGSGSVGQN